MIIIYSNARYVPDDLFIALKAQARHTNGESPMDSWEFVIAAETEHADEELIEYITKKLGGEDSDVYAIGSQIVGVTYNQEEC